MKKLLLILLIVPLFISCSSDDDEQTQDYTSFVVTNQSSQVDLPNVTVGYLIDGKFKRITALGDIKANGKSEEYILSDNNIKGVYFFSDYAGVIRINKEFTIKKNAKNLFNLSGDIQTISVTDKTDPTQYPQ